MDKFRYLDVPELDEIMVYDDFECTFRCLHHPLCVSVNLAAEGDLWCELLSSDKYSNPNEYKEKKSSHHYFFEVRRFTPWLHHLSCTVSRKILRNRRKMQLLRARSRLKDSRKDKTFFYNPAEEFIQKCYDIRAITLMIASMKSSL